MTLEYNDYEEYNDYDPLPTRPRRRWLEILLLTGFVVCLLIGLAALLVLLAQFRTSRPGLSVTPVQAIQTTAIMPQLALMQLAGDPVDGLAFQAMNAGQLETSRAMLTYNAPISGAGNIELLMQLAHAYQDQNQPLAAAQLYRVVQTMTILDSSTSSFERSQALVQCSTGLLSAGERAAALDSAIQAKRVAEQAPELLPAQRSQIFATLRPLATQLDDPTFNSQIGELVRNPFLKPAGFITATNWLTLATPLAFNADLTTAIATRQQRARELSQRIDLTQGTDIDPERQALAQALIDEDRLRHDYTSSVLSTGLSLSQQFWLLEQQREWLILKVRVAQHGFGLPVVSSWETNLDALQQELSISTSRVTDVLNAFANAQSRPVDQALWRVSMLKWLALQTELGLYPNADPAEIGERLRAAQVELSRFGSAPPLPVAYVPDATPPGFRIQPFNPQ
ncbi:MAG: hypothetical protein NT075_32430 [Chloroflexi bacterium]|nr:hypothetical protein [Chloroflexota bacterium]